MKDQAKDVVRACAAGSDANSMTFPQALVALSAVGVERYHADLTRAEKTFYLASGESEVVACDPVDGAFAAEFSPAGVDAAVRAVQRAEINYREFCRRIAAAGCVDYVVSLAGRRAVYCGRTAEAHVEWFPPA